MPTKYFVIIFFSYSIMVKYLRFKFEFIYLFTVKKPVIIYKLLFSKGMIGGIRCKIGAQYSWPTFNLVAMHRLHCPLSLIWFIINYRKLVNSLVLSFFSLSLIIMLSLSLSLSLPHCLSCPTSLSLSLSLSSLFPLSYVSLPNSYSCVIPLSTIKVTV